MFVRFAVGVLLAGTLRGQIVCPPTPQYSPCDLVFDAAPTPGTEPAELEAEFRSPRQTTALVKAFQDGSRRVIRFTPSEAGTYTYRLKSSLAGLGGKEGQFTATAVSKPGWLRAANLHHFAYVEGNNLSPHLWMGAVVPRFASMDPGAWKALIDKRSAQHFNHFSVTLVDAAAGKSFETPGFFAAAEEKIRYANQHGVMVDIAFFGPDGLLSRLLPGREQRRAWFTYALSRLAAFDVTWQGLESWESYDNGRELLNEIAEYLTAFDPYKHTRSTRTAITSAPLADDGWLRYRSYQGADDSVASIEQQIYQYPAISNFAPDEVDEATFRRRLWNSSMAGQYPATLVASEQNAAAMKVWYEFMRETRHWELEPFFDTDNGRGLALEGVEYIVYPDHPGSVTVTLEKHGYDAEWLNPANGASVRIKEIKTEVFTGEPPDRTHDWVLHISRESHKAGMLKSYKFDSREAPPILQEIEGNPEKVPFEVVEPAGETLPLGSASAFSLKLKRQSKALQRMTCEWTGEVTVDGASYRVIGTGASGTLRIPANIARQYPAALHVRVLGMNALGKVYMLDRNYTLTR